MAKLQVCGLVTEREQSLFGAIERHRDVGRLVVRVCGDIGCGAKETAEYCAIADDSSMSLDFHRGRNSVGEFSKVGGAANSDEFFTTCQLDLHRKLIDPFATFQKGTSGVINLLVTGYVEVVRSEQIGDLVDRIPIDKETSENLPLGFKIKWDVAINCGSERHNRE